MIEKKGKEDKKRGRREPNILEFKNTPEYNGNKKFTRRTQQQILTSRKKKSINLKIDWLRLSKLRNNKKRKIEEQWMKPWRPVGLHSSIPT